jgi:hypothetical protein
MQNLVFIPSCGESLSQLHKLGLELYSVKIDASPYIMVVTNQLRQMEELAKRFNKTKLFISDSRRQTFRLDLFEESFIPTKIGVLRRTSKDGSSMMKNNSTGAIFLLVSEGNLNYHYSTQ